MASAFADFDEDRGGVSKVSEIFSTGRDLQQTAAEPAQAPMDDQCDGFKRSIEAAIEECNTVAFLPNCFRNGGGYRITETDKTVRKILYPGFCCCACYKIEKCKAVHYNNVNRSCVFHCGVRAAYNKEEQRWAWIRPDDLG